jgi:hypothetical protein
MSASAGRPDGQKSGEYQAIQLMINETLLKMADFLLENGYDEALGEGIGYFYGLDNDVSYSFMPAQEILFLGWLLFDCQDDNDRLIADDYIDTYSDELRSEDLQICHGFKETYMTCLCIKKRTKSVYVLRDIFLGNEIVVPLEYFGGADIPTGGVLFTRVMKLMDEYFLIGAGLFLEKKRVKSLSEYMREKYKDFCDAYEKVSFRDFLKRNGELLHWWIREIEEPQMPPPDESDEE